MTGCCGTADGCAVEELWAWWWKLSLLLINSLRRERGRVRRCIKGKMARSCGPRLVQRLNHKKAMSTVASELVDQTIFPIQISLHRFSRGVGAFVRSSIAVGPWRGQVAFAGFYREPRCEPGTGAALEQEHLFASQSLDVCHREPCQATTAAGQHIAFSGRHVSERFFQLPTQCPPGAGDVLLHVVGTGGEIQYCNVAMTAPLGEGFRADFFDLRRRWDGGVPFAFFAEVIGAQVIDHEYLPTQLGKP